MAAPLTPKQAEIYQFILQYTKDHGYPPPCGKSVPR